MWLLKQGFPTPNGSLSMQRGGNTPACEFVFNAVHSRMVRSVQWLIRPLEPQNPERTRHAEIKDCVRGQYLRKPRMAGCCYRRHIGSVVRLLLSNKLYNRHERQQINLA
jgi:hypothetical protein